MTLDGEQLQRHAREVAAALDDVSDGRPFTAGLDVWKVHGKVFLIVTDDDPDLQIITVKANPDRGDALRRDLGTVTAGRYLDKHHWISIGPGHGVTAELVEDLVQDSYDLAGDRATRRQS